MNPGEILLLSVGAALVAGLTILVLLNTGLAWRIAMDEPNARSLHVRPTPRVGGWGLMVALFCLAPWVGMVWLLLPVALLMFVSFADDRLGLSSALRFVVHGFAAALFLGMSGLGGGWWLLPVGLSLVWMINLYNFMDGSDGLAGGMAVVGFGSYAVAAVLAGDGVLASWAGILAGAAAGFLAFNLHPAKVFMGDVGSVPLGFLAGSLGLFGWHSNAWPLWFPVVVFGPFIADATVTLIRRILRGERFWHAHREHCYQRLVLSGFGHARTAWGAYVLMLFCAVVAVLALHQDPLPAAGVLALVPVVFVGVGVWIERRWRKS